ncbi:MAG: acyl-ACP--UDP-N-acetylglucosamine O-acyltransferase [Spongiibacteraceae bacterium]|nr:acyl-ACP--UDP-N-acetylglucosamine O-acyltransferase [Spongiibacteraceae bacterium]
MIDPRAIVDPSAILADDVEVGPWTMIGADVEIAAGTVIASHVVIKGPTKIGKNNKIYQFSSIGEDTPDLKYKGEPTRLQIGDDNVIREGVTIHRGTIQDRFETTIGNNNLLMAYVHVGHDSVIGHHCVFANNASCAGHVVVGDWVILGGYTLVHQFCHIGAHCFTGMGSAIGKDVPAYVVVNGSPASAKGINIEGLKRRGYSSDVVVAIRRAYKIIYRQGLTTEEALFKLKKLYEQHDEIALLIRSLESSTRGIVR